MVMSGTRLRQAVLVAADRSAAERSLGEHLGLRDPFHDPAVAPFGLSNAVFTAGDTFLEVVSPAREGTTAGRYRERIGGDGGYMAMFQVPDIDVAQKRLVDLDVRIVFDGSHPDIADLHLHPKDVPGAIVALNEPRPPGSWRFGGAAWEAKVPHDIAPGGLRGLTVRSPDPEALAGRWAAVLGLDVSHDGAGGAPSLELDGGLQRVRFVDAAGAPEGICGIALAVPAAVRAGRDEIQLLGVTFTLCDA
jgi:hypothetical protein